VTGQERTVDNAGERRRSYPAKSHSSPHVDLAWAF